MNKSQKQDKLVRRFLDPAALRVASAGAFVVSAYVTLDMLGTLAPGLDSANGRHRHYLFHFPLVCHRDLRPPY